MSTMDNRYVADILNESLKTKKYHKVKRKLRIIKRKMLPLFHLDEFSNYFFMLSTKRKSRVNLGATKQNFNLIGLAIQMWTLLIYFGTN